MQSILGSWSAIALAAGLILASAVVDAQTIRIGAFDAGSPIWNRPKDLDPVSPTCELAAEDATADGVPYAAYDLEVTEPEDLVAEIVDEGTSEAFDPMLILYCAPFDPLDPLANLVATNDDRAVLNALPAFTAERGIALEPGQTYTIVVTTFNPADFGTFELALQSPTAHFVPEPGDGRLVAALALGVFAAARGRSKEVQRKAMDAGAGRRRSEALTRLA